MKKIFLNFVFMVSLSSFLYAKDDVKQDVQKTVSMIGQAPDIPKDDKYVLLENAARLMSDKKYSQAEQEINKALKADPRFADAHRAKVYLYMQKGIAGDVFKNLDKLIEIDPDNQTEYLYTKAMFYVLAGEPKKALKTNKAVSKLFPEFPDVHYLDAMAYAALLEMDKAEKSLQKAEDGKKNGLPASFELDRIYFMRGIIDIDFGEYDKAVNDFIAAGQYNAFTCKTGLVIAYIEKKEIEKAEALVNELGAEYPDQFMTYFVKGRLEYEKKEYDAATLSFKRTLEMFPSMNEAYYYLASIYIMSEKFTDAFNAMNSQTANAHKEYVYKDDLKAWTEILDKHGGDENVKKIKKLLNSKYEKRDRILKR